MRFNSLQQWLDWQESLNPKEIDLGLQRVAEVLQRMDLSAQFGCPVISVAGTNGKGSSVAMLESMLGAGGYRVGCYTSPHLLTYNERIRIDAECVDDARLCQAFDAVDQARGEVALTYFEFGTLAALQIFAQAQLDVVVLEVGLGGRLDAVNVIDADVALITTVDIDHTDWLGTDIETIAAEKAGIMRPHRPAVYAGINCPQAIRHFVEQHRVALKCAAVDYIYQAVSDDVWQLRGDDFYLAELSRPALPGAFQLANAAGAIMALHALPGIQLEPEQINRGLQTARLAGRFDYVQRRPDIIIDVAHNAQAARALRDQLRDTPVQGRTLAVIAMLKDKAVDKVVGVLQAEVDQWFSAGLASSRGLDAESMAKTVKRRAPDVKLCSQSTVAQACQAALAEAQENDRIIIMGSFLTAAEAWHTLNG